MMDSDPNSWIQASVVELSNTLGSKNADYAPDGEFSNFEKAAEVVGTDPLYVITTQAAIKMTRIESILKVDDQPNNESLVDSFLDLAGYAIIAHAYLSANTHVIKPGPVEPEPDEGKVFHFPRHNPAG